MWNVLRLREVGGRPAWACDRCCRCRRCPTKWWRWVGMVGGLMLVEVVYPPGRSFWAIRIWVYRLFPLVLCGLDYKVYITYIFHTHTFLCVFLFTRDMIIFFYDRKHSTFFQWEYMNSSHAHLLKWHFKGRLGPRRHRSLGNLWGHQVASKAADSESCLDWTREAAKMRIHTTGINTTCDVWDHFRHSESSW